MRRRRWRYSLDKKMRQKQSAGQEVVENGNISSVLTHRKRESIVHESWRDENGMRNVVEPATNGLALAPVLARQRRPPSGARALPSSRNDDSLRGPVTRKRRRLEEHPQLDGIVTVAAPSR
jgi:hypothetical protein